MEQTSLRNSCLDINNRSSNARQLNTPTPTKHIQMNHLDINNNNQSKELRTVKSERKLEISQKQILDANFSTFNVVQKEEEDKYSSKQNDVYTFLVNDMDQKINSLKKELKEANQEIDNLRQTLKQESQENESTKASLQNEIKELKEKQKGFLEDEVIRKSKENIVEEKDKNMRKLEIIIGDQLKKINYQEDLYNKTINELENIRDNHSDLVSRNNKLVSSYKKVIDDLIIKFDEINNEYNENFNNFIKQVSISFLY